MGKVEIYFCVTADILKKVLQKCSLGSPLPATWILSKSLILIGCHANRKAKFSKKRLKHLLRSHEGMKLKLSIHVHDISLYIIYVFYCRCPCGFVAMASFHRLTMVKVELGIYFCVTADILTKVLQKCSWSSPLPTIWILSKSLILIGCHATRTPKFLKKIFKNLLLRSHKGDEAETLHKCLCYYSLHKLCSFYCCCACGFIAMAT